MMMKVTKNEIALLKVASRNWFLGESAPDPSTITGTVTSDTLSVWDRQ